MTRKAQDHGWGVGAVLTFVLFIALMIGETVIIFEGASAVSVSDLLLAP